MTDEQWQQIVDGMVPDPPEVQFREIRQHDPLYRARYWQAWAITTAVWVGVIWFTAVQIVIPVLTWIGNGWSE